MKNKKLGTLLKGIVVFVLILTFTVPVIVNAQTSNTGSDVSEVIVGEVNQENTFVNDRATNVDDIEARTDIADSEKLVTEESESSTASKSISTASSSGGTWIEASDGRWWYKHADGSYTTDDWEQIDGKWYYFDSSGWMLTGWQKIDGYWYYFKPGDSGWMVTGWYQVGTNWYFLGSDGKMRIGWQKIGDYWYYFNPGDSGKMITGWCQVGVNWYYLESDGKMVTGWKKLDGCWYYFNTGDSGKMLTGWQEISDKWYYLGTDGKMVTGWQTIDGNKYLFKSGDSGYMITGWYQISDDFYFFQSNGVMQTSPFSDSRCYYVFYTSGRLKKLEENITRQSQQKTNWCWAACASMTGEYITGTRKAQSSIVTYVKGTPINEGAIVPESVSAANFACSDSKSWNYVDVADFSFQNAVSILNDQETFEIRYRWYSGGGHILVCAGYDLENQRLRLVDPWENCPTTYYKYSELCDGTTIQTGNGWLAGVFRYPGGV